MEQNKTAKVNRRLLAGVIVLLLLLIAAGVAGGVAFSGVLWYRDQVDALTETNRQTVEDLQKRLDEAEKKLAEAQEEQANRQQTAEEEAAKNAELQEQIEDLKKELEEAQKQVTAMAEKTAEPVMVYPEDAKLIALTFDDGPGKNTTPRLLDEMKKRDVKATFFVIGANAAKYPDLLKRMADEGHAVGSHTWSHKNLRTANEETLKEQLAKCSDVIQNAVGHAPTLLRPPGGNFDNRLLEVCKTENLAIIDWCVDTKDWESRNSSAVVDAAFIKGDYGIRDGAIVLMHDVYESTVDAAVEIMDRLQQEGYILVTVPELLRVRAGGAEPGRVYYSDTRFKDSV